jgi:hypothetical protein
MYFFLKIYKYLRFILIIVLLWAPVFSKKSPFSKIIIESKEAVGKPNNKKNLYSFAYKNNVIVTLSDGTKITTDFLDIIIDISNKKQEIKKIFLKNNIYIKNNKNNIRANNGFIDVSKKKCFLYDNIKVERIEDNKEEVPIKLESDKAILNLLSKKVTFFGKNKPVKTTIKLGNYIKN